MDVEMEEARPEGEGEQVVEMIDMGYEDHAPTVQLQRRRGSMSHDEEKQRRASIKAIMADTKISPMAKRRSIQHLMDGRRNSIDGGRRLSMEGGRRGSITSSVHSGYNSSTGSTCNETPDLGYDQVDMGYGYVQQVEEEDEAIPQSHVTRGFALCNEQTRRTELSRPPCTHYERKCTIVAACCGAAFGCRICHDDCPVLPPKINNGGRRYHRSASLPGSFTSMPRADEDETHHQIDRFATREVICRECYTRQSSKTNNCVNCGIQFGAYHCDICNLWMSDEEAPYHCTDCGFCRVGGAHNFQHCHDCGMCIDRTLYNNHNCKAGKYRSNCPVCQEFLFSSRSASHEMPCGHAIHWDCFRQLAAHDSRCPVCKKTAETRDRMMPTWNAMAAGIALQPVPPELARVVNISCNDCEQTEQNRAWHFLGVQCSHCSSFNTVVDRLVLSGESAHQFLEEQQQQLQQQQQYSEEMAQNRPPRRRMNRRRSAF